MSLLILFVFFLVHTYIELILSVSLRSLTKEKASHSFMYIVTDVNKLKTSYLELYIHMYVHFIYICIYIFYAYLCIYYEYISIHICIVYTYVHMYIYLKPMCVYIMNISLTFPIQTFRCKASL